jgi:D-sedoheptulose 7-phosphate isomerase
LGFRITSSEKIERKIGLIMNDIIEKKILESAKIIQESVSLSNKIQDAVLEIYNSLIDGNKIYLFGNGGSAADAQHIAAELIGRYKIERESIPAVSLTTDTSILSSLSNDYSFETIFSRQCESLVEKNDIVIAISTSGNSKNVINGLQTAKQIGAYTIGLLGHTDGQINKIVDIAINVDSKSTARIQEAHRIIYHIICELVEKNLTV